NPRRLPHREQHHVHRHNRIRLQSRCLFSRINSHSYPLNLTTTDFIPSELFYTNPSFLSRPLKQYWKPILKENSSQNPFHSTPFCVTMIEHKFYIGRSYSSFV